MAEAAKRIPREWTLDDYHRLVRITLRCGINVALCEMERRIVSEQSLLKCDGAVVNRFDFLSNYTFQFDIDDRVKVVTRRPDTPLLLPGGITSIKLDPSDPKSAVVRGPGRVMDGYYTIVERPACPPASQSAPRQLENKTETAEHPPPSSLRRSR
jgi:hypothetical protein